MALCGRAPEVATAKATAKPAAQKPMKPTTAAQMKIFAALYEADDKVSLKRGMQFLRDILTPDFKLHLFGETYERAQYLRNMTDFYQEIIKAQSSKSVIEKLEFYDKQTFVVCTSTHQFTMCDESGKVRQMKMIQRSRDNWISTSRGWRVQSVTAISERNFIDGKQVSARP